MGLLELPSLSTFYYLFYTTIISSVVCLLLDKHPKDRSWYAQKIFLVSLQLSTRVLKYK